MKARSVFAAAAVGSAVEYYDYYAYITAAALVFPTVFFPSLGVEAARLASFATLGATFVARPVGAVVFGHFGDRFGRKRLLVAALLLMGVATVGVGLTPGFDRIGLAAPVVLLLLRFVQGFAVGGEFGGAVVLASESAPAGRRGLMSSAGTFGSALGLLMSTLSFLVVSLLGAGHSAAFLSWGWRVPFLASGLLVLVGLSVRGRVPESPEFVEARQAGALARSPLARLLRERPAQLAFLTGSVVALYMVFYIKDVFLVSVARTELRLGFDEILAVNTVAALVMLLGVAASGYLSDKFERKTLYLVGLALTAAWSAGATWMLTSGLPAAFPATMWLAASVLGVVNGSVGAFLVEDFPVHLRYSGFSFAFNVAGVLGGIVPPMLATSLYSWGGAGAVGLLLAAFSLASLACAVATKRFARA